MKTCSKCKIEKLLTDFHKHKNTCDGLQVVCRACKHDYYYKYNPEYWKQHYLDNTEVVKARSAKKWRDCQAYVCEFLAERCCDDCGEDDIRVLEFDHGDNQKDYNIGQLSNVPSVKVLQQEIAKCEVVCANCHRKRTLTKTDSFKVRYYLEQQQQEKLLT